MSKKRELIHGIWLEQLGKKGYDLISDRISDNGYIDKFDAFMLLKDCDGWNNASITDYHSIGMKHGEISLVRPSKISIILENNGWISVNNKQDMPKEDCLVKICMEGKVNSVVHQWFAKDGLLEATQLEVNGYRTHTYRFWLNTVSHYKIYIVEPEPLF